jgi:hypothetical protein
VRELTGIDSPSARLLRNDNQHGSVAVWDKFSLFIEKPRTKKYNRSVTTHFPHLNSALDDRYVLCPRCVGFSPIFDDVTTTFEPVFCDDNPNGIVGEKATPCFLVMGVPRLHEVLYERFRTGTLGYTAGDEADNEKHRY